jgi:filamentous hemagglutinin
MNGRVYDYALGRFLGVDPFIQFPSNSQSLNPYSYILNNPLAGTDPTGYAACGDISSGDPGSGTCDFTQNGKTTEVNFSVGSNGTVAVAGKGVSTSVLSGLVSTGVLRSDSGASAGTGARGDSNTGKSTSDIGNTRGTASNPTQLPPVKAVIGSRADLATGREANAAGDVFGGLANIILENAPLTSDAIAINEFRKDPTFANGLVAVAGAVPLLGDRIAPGLRAALRSSDEVAGVADGVGDASSVVNSVRLRGQLVGQEIAGGHAFEKHVLQRGEFAGLGIRTRAQFASHIEGAVNNPTAVRQLGGGRTAYWHEGSGTVVIRNPRAADGGTAFQPLFGRSYFDGLR